MSTKCLQKRHSLYYATEFSDIVPQDVIPVILAGLIVVPIVWYFAKVKRYKQLNMGERT